MTTQPAEADKGKDAPTVLIITRHVLTDYNKDKRVQGARSNRQPSAEGIEQAKKLAKELLKYRIDVVYSSDLDRCRLTIEPFVKEAKVPVHYTKSSGRGITAHSMAPLRNPMQNGKRIIISMKTLNLLPRGRILQRHKKKSRKSAGKDTPEGEGENNPHMRAQRQRRRAAACALQSKGGGALQGLHALQCLDNCSGNSGWETQDKGIEFHKAPGSHLIFCYASLKK